MEGEIIILVRMVRIYLGFVYDKIVAIKRIAMI